jgi:hypothetical protein
MAQHAPLEDAGDNAGSDAGACSNPAPLSVSPQSIDFGSAVVDTVTSHIVTITNCAAVDMWVTPEVTGPQASLFALQSSGQSSQAFWAPAGQAVSLTVSYAPTAPSMLDLADVQLAFSSGDSAVVMLQGRAVQSALSISPVPLNFAFVQPGDSLTRPLHLSNISNEKISVMSAVIVDPGTPAAYSIAGTSWTGGDLQPGESQDVAVTFAPTVKAQFTGELDIRSTDSPAIVAVPLIGYGGGAIISCSPSSVDFGAAAVNIGAVSSVLCTNIGSDVPNHPEAGLILSAVQLDDTAFSAQVSPQSMTQASSSQPTAAGRSVRIDLTYMPPAAGATDTGTLTIDSNATDGTSISPPEVSLQGTSVGEQPCMYAIAPAAVQFGEVPLSTSMPGMPGVPSGFTISNLGPNTCLVSGLGLSSVTDSAFTLPGGPVAAQRLSPPGPAAQYPTFLQVNVDFSPQQAGSYSGAVEFTISDPAAPNQSVPLSGEGGNSCFVVLPGSLDFGTFGMNDGLFCGVSPRQVSAINNCGKSVTITTASISGSSAYSVTSGAAPQIISAGSTMPFLIGFHPTAAGIFDATLLLQTDRQTIPFGVGLSGTASAGTQQVDSFPAHAPAADVLFVMDSDDDLSERTLFSQHVPDIVAAAQNLGLDFQFGVTSTNDCPASDPDGDQGRLIPCPGCSVDGTQPTIITSADANAADDLASLVLLGSIMGDGCSLISDDEHFFDVADKALASGVNEVWNSGLVRPDAYLAIITVNGDNEDEQDPQTPQWYANQLLSVKGTDHPELFSWSYVNPTGAGAPGGHQPFTALPERIQNMLDLAGGVAIDTAQTDWWKGVSDLWNIALASSTYYPLSGIPDPSSIVLYLDGPPPSQTPIGGSAGIQITATNPNGSMNWTYDATSNSIHLNSAELVLSSSDTLYVQYTLVCP